MHTTDCSSCGGVWSCTRIIGFGRHSSSCFHSSYSFLRLVRAFGNLAKSWTYESIVSVTGVLHLIQITAPETSSWATANLPFNFTILYGVVALLVNIILTSLITIRLYVHRRRSVRALGSGHGTDFTGIIAMLIESAFLADVFVISFLVPYAIRHWFCNVIIQPLIQVQVSHISRIIGPQTESSFNFRLSHLSSLSSELPKAKRGQLRPTKTAPQAQTEVERLFSTTIVAHPPNNLLSTSQGDRVWN